MTPTQTRAQILSKAFSSSITNACMTMQQINPETDLIELMNTYERKTDIMLTGDTRPIETMLMAQAYTLESIFQDMARIAVNASHLPMKQVCMDMALKAQKQCRQTLSALVDM